MPDAETLGEAALSSEKAVEEAKEPSKTPAPAATGNEKITILKHNLPETELVRDEVCLPGVELAIRNVSDSTIGTAVFEVVFYDKEGNIVDTVKHRETDLPPDTSRGIDINSSLSKFDGARIKSYDVRLVRTTTADVEKVQLRRHVIRTTETGEEEIVGIVKNISAFRTDAALVAAFYDTKEECIGTKGVVLRDIEPNAVRQYDLRFKPQEGDMVGSYRVVVGEIAG